MTVGRAILFQFADQQVAVEHHPGEQIVEVVGHASNQAADRLQPLRFPQLPLRLLLPADVPCADDLKIMVPLVKADPGYFEVQPITVGARKHKVCIPNHFTCRVGLRPDENREWVLRDEVGQFPSLQLRSRAFEQFTPGGIGVHNKAGCNDCKTLGKSSTAASSRTGSGAPGWSGRCCAVALVISCLPVSSPALRSRSFAACKRKH